MPDGNGGQRQSWPGQHFEGSGTNGGRAPALQSVWPKLGSRPPQVPVAGSHVVPVPHAFGQVTVDVGTKAMQSPGCLLSRLHAPSVHRLVGSGVHGVGRGKSETWQIPPLQTPASHWLGGIGEHDVPSGMLPAMHSPPAQIPSTVDRHRASAGGGGLQYPKSLMLAGAHWPFWQVPTVGDK